MKKKRTLMLGIQLLLLVGTAIAFMIYTKSEIKPVTAYVFNGSLTANSKISESDIKSVEVPASAVTSSFALDPKEIVGKYVDVDVYGNTYVYSAQLVEEGKTDPFKSMDLSKYRKISLPISYVDGFGGDIMRGDRVDLLFTGQGSSKDEGGKEQKFQYSKTFLQDVLVYSVTTADGYDYVSPVNGGGEKGSKGEEISTTTSSDELSVITLAVTLDQAEEIEARLKTGKIRLLARFSESESYETLGFVLGEYSKIFSAPANAETGFIKVNK
ncbi:Flp pilus assembly protein CpaB (plasmid) [Paenibacillus thiaminolyticus]|uniref:Flp pilus assembly protein CpaB n=1 Tax=Paenibacillus thiaminolyticus TaxID=49283 RepID=UPI00232E891E|nr:Flp pilus assembly protein CpaB [Paenibacillus thiaminolyticus]WCF11738.1 Flp pilus assembly protein CpaB [Paenibacillus thiaminolyticus]